MTLLFDIKLTWYQRSVTCHCSHYLQALLFCLFFFEFFFCWNTHSHLSLWSLLLITFAVFPSCAQTPLPSCSLSWRILPKLWMIPSPPQRPHLSLMGPTQGNSVSRTRCFADKTGSSKPGSVHQRWLNVDIYTSCISKARTIQKLWTLYGDENILGDRCFTLDCYCCF